LTSLAPSLSILAAAALGENERQYSILLGVKFFPSGFQGPFEACLLEYQLDFRSLKIQRILTMFL